MTARRRRHDSYTAGEVAAIFYVSTRTVGKWIDSGALPGYRLPSGHRRVLGKDVEAFLAKHGMADIKLEDLA